MTAINQTNQEPATILVVDDEALLRDAMVFDLKRKGFRVLAAEDGQVALNIVKNEKVHVVISDIRMPVLDGTEFLKKVREISESTPLVVLVTGFADIDLQEAYHLGACSLITKPYDRKALMDVIYRMLQPAELRWDFKSESPRSHAKVQLRVARLKKAADTQLVNLGQGGMFISGLSSIPNVGDKVEFSIQIESMNLSKIEGVGIVRWTRMSPSGELKAGCGIEFLHIDEKLRTQVLTLIQNLQPKAYIPKN